MDTKQILEIVIWIVQAGAIGFFMPYLVGLVNQHISNTTWRKTIALVACGIAGAIMVAYNNIGHLVPVSAILIGIITEAQVFYNLYWKPMWDKK